MEPHSEIIFDAAGAKPAAIAAVLHARGAVLIRGLLNRETVLRAGQAVHENGHALKAMLGKDVNDMPVCFADLYRAGEPSPESYPGGAPLESFKDPLTASGMDKSWYYEGDRNFKKWFWENGATLPNTILRAMMVDSIAPRVAEHYFEGPSVSPYQHNTVRYQRADLAHISYGFHQDGSYQSREKNEHRSLTTWVPLTDCGEDAPNLQIYPHKLDEILPLPPGAKMPFLFCDEKEVLTRFGEKLWAPILRAGDVLMFDGFTVHRSHILPGMTRERQSADMRFYPKEHMPTFVKEAKGWVFNIK